MKDWEREVFVRALEAYGPKKQIDKALEEMAELQVELCHYLDGRPDYAGIATEIADVGILLDQMTLLFQCGGKVQQERMRKVQRLEERITVGGKKS